MSRYHELTDLAPRDIVARAMLAEMRAANADHVWLDCTAIETVDPVERFPRSLPSVATRGSICGGSRFRSHPRPTTSWAAFPQTSGPARPWPGCTPAARWPRRGCMGRIASRVIPCSKRSCSVSVPSPTLQRGRRAMPRNARSTPFAPRSGRLRATRSCSACSGSTLVSSARARGWQPRSPPPAGGLMSHRTDASGARTALAGDVRGAPADGRAHPRGEPRRALPHRLPRSR